MPLGPFGGFMVSSRLNGPWFVRSQTAGANKKQRQKIYSFLCAFFRHLVFIGVIKRRPEAEKLDWQQEFCEEKRELRRQRCGFEYDDGSCGGSCATAQSHLLLKSHLKPEPRVSLHGGDASETRRVQIWRTIVRLTLCLDLRKAWTQSDQEIRSFLTWITYRVTDGILILSWWKRSAG